MAVQKGKKKKCKVNIDVSGSLDFLHGGISQRGVKVEATALSSSDLRNFSIHLIQGSSCVRMSEVGMMQILKWGALVASE